MREDTHDANLFANRCWDFACEITTLRNNDLFRRDFNLRYTAVRGAYLSFEDYCDDVIIMHNNEIPRNKTNSELSSWFQNKLSNKPFFATV